MDTPATDTPTGEQWIPIEGYENRYSVSNAGRVRSEFSHAISRPGLILRPYLRGGGYLYVRLNAAGVRRSKPIHRLVARAFIGTCPEGLVVNHIDGVKINNRRDNLEYCTPLENHKHARETGLIHPKVDLATKDRLCSAYKKANSIRAAAAAIGISRGEAHRILKQRPDVTILSHQKLDANDVLHIRRLLSDGVQQREIANRFNVGESVISRIKSGQRWSRVPK